jgi:hypothetical protein
VLRYERGLLGETIPFVRLTAVGRKLARHLLGQSAPKRLPAGILRERHWRALARAYAAGDAGLAGASGTYAGIGWPSWRRLRDYTAGALVSEHGLRPPYDHRLRITAAGRALYEQEWGRYRELYPHIEAPAPALMREVAR